MRLRAGRPRGARRHPPPVLQPVDPRRASGSGSARFGAAALAFLWPSAGGGFGGKVNVGSVADAKDAVRQQDPVLQRGGEDLHRQPTRRTTLPKAKKVYRDPRDHRRDGAGLRRAVPEVRAPRLPGAVVPESQWFECPCHGSKYNRVGEKQGGPAPRGLDRFPLEVVGRQHHRRHRQPDRAGPADRHRHHRPEPGGRALCLTAHRVDIPRRHRSRSSDAVSLRTSLIVLNAVAFVGHRRHHRVARLQPAAQPRAEGAREPHAVLRRRGPRGPAPRARARVVADLRDDRGRRRCRLLPLASRAARPTRTTASTSAPSSAARSLFANSQSPRVRRDQVAAVRELPRRRRRGRDGAVRAPARGSTVRRRSRTRATPTSPSACRSRWRGQAPALNTARLRFDRGAAHQHHHLRPPGTPMPAWGVKSGKGVLNEQSINDLVNYLESIQITSDSAPRSARTEAVGEYRRGWRRPRRAAGEGARRRPGRSSPTAQAKPRRDATDQLAEAQLDDHDRERQLDQGRGVPREVAAAERRRRSCSGSTARAATRRAGRTTTRRTSTCRRSRRRAAARSAPTSPTAPTTAPVPGLRPASQQQFDWVALGVAGQQASTACAASRRAACRTSAAAHRGSDQGDHRVRAQPVGA